MLTNFTHVTELTIRKIGGDSKLDNKELTNNSNYVDNIIVMKYIVERWREALSLETG